MPRQRRAARWMTLAVAVIALAALAAAMLVALQQGVAAFMFSGG